MAAVCSKEAQQKGLKAGVLVKEVAQLCGGNGGGRPDFAMRAPRTNLSWTTLWLLCQSW